MYKRAKRQVKRQYQRTLCFSFSVVLCVVFTACVMPQKQSMAVEEGIWKAAGQQQGSEVMQDWLGQNGDELQELSGIGIVLPETCELFGIDLVKGNGGICFEKMSGEQLEIMGRKDTDRGYFEGEITWIGQEICIVDFNTMEYVVLQESMRSFILGDYYVSCRYDTENSELELLIFYCPA